MFSYKIKYESVGVGNRELDSINYTIVIRGKFEENHDAIHLTSYDVLIVNPEPDKETMNKLKTLIDGTMYLDTWKWDNPRLNV